MNYFIRAQKYMTCTSAFWTVIIMLSLCAISSAAEPPTVTTSRKSSKTLPLPKGDDVYHFVVFGDRTGGPVDGVRVLADAVEDSNLLDPDLVMTVGDLVNGYNQTDVWMEQMVEYRDIMNKLNMPWFPVAGNHDIYWRRSNKNPEPQPPNDHEDNFEKHFGPLWYWFEHKDTGFLVLFSDENSVEGGTRSFGDPKQQKISPEQMDWIKTSLVEMKKLKHVFVFLHHPFWWNDRYPGSNWNDIHELLVQTGNVRAVMAGHIHRMRYDGVKDGIEYHALAVTGGGIDESRAHRYFGTLHHFNVVTVRDDSFSIAAVPVGAVFDPKQFTPARIADAEAARYLQHEFVSYPIGVALDGTATAVYEVSVQNPCSLPIDIELIAKGDESWTVGPDHHHATLKPGERKVFAFACVRPETSSLIDYQAPDFELRFDVLTPKMRLKMPPVVKRAKSSLITPKDGWPVDDEKGGFTFDGKTACLEIEKESISIPKESFTVEAWVKPTNDRDGGLVSNLTSGGFALDVIDTPLFTVRMKDRRYHVKSKEKLKAGQWHHLAGVFDGKQLRLFVDGQLKGTVKTEGTPTTADKSLYIGARPNSRWNLYNISKPTGFWNGTVDDVRVSHGPRYQSDFVPDIRLAQDKKTLFLLSNDQHYGPFVPILGKTPMHAVIIGPAKLLTEKR